MQNSDSASPPDEQKDDDLDMVSVPCETAYMGEGELLIFDWAEFCEAFDCYAATFRSGQLFILDRQTKRWRDAESPKGERGKLASVKKTIGDQQ